MALLYIDSFDHYATVDTKVSGISWGKRYADTSSAPYVIGSANGRNGTNAIRFSDWNSSGARYDLRSVITTGIFGFAFRFSAFPSAESPICSLAELVTPALHLTLSTNGSGDLIVRRGSTSSGTILTTYAANFQINTYYYIEVKATIDDAAGIVIVKIDQNTVINLTSIDTRNGGNANFNRITLGNAAVGSNGAVDFDVDDFYVCDTSGSLNNDFLGDCRVVAVLPDGNGFTNQWTPSAGSNYQAVDENPPDDNTTYVHPSALNDIDLYAFPSIGLSLAPLGVAVWAHCAGTIFAVDYTIRVISRPGSTNYYSPSSDNIAPANPYIFRGDIFETNGDTGLVWTLGEIENAEFGVQNLTGTPDSSNRVTQVALEVLFSSTVTGTRLTQYVVEAITQPDASAGLPLIRISQYVVEAVLSTSTVVTPGTPCAPTSSIQQTYPPCYGAEFDTYIAPDGHEYEFHVSRGLRFLMTEQGFGMPPISYITSVGPFQHGETLRDWFLMPRVIELMISNRSLSRQEYTRQRAMLLDAIRPNRQVSDSERKPGVLRKRLSDGSIRDLKVVIESGPNFNPRDLARWDEYRFQEILRFIAHDPILYNPTQQCRSFLASGSGSPGSGGGTQLMFPATFPITFGIGTGSSGSSSGGLSGTLQYNGTWEEYPKIVIHGPVTSPVIQNTTTEERLALETDILEDEIVTFDLTYATKTVTRENGTNMLGYLSDDSDLATFHLSTVNGGANQIVISGSGTNSSMFVEIFYYERFIGR